MASRSVHPFVLFFCSTFVFCYCSMNGILEFVDTADMTVMMQAEHFMATDVEWDPTGRYVATSVSWWGHKVDNAYWLWNFQGKLLHKQPLDRFCQLQWRPRPPSLLSDDHLKVLVAVINMSFCIGNMSLYRGPKPVCNSDFEQAGHFHGFTQKANSMPFTILLFLFSVTS